MNPSSDEILEAKFVCKGIAIEKVNIETQGNNEAIDEGNQTNANSTNTTNSTTNTNTTNSTANTNTTNR